MTIEEAIQRLRLFDPFVTKDFSRGTRFTCPSGKVTLTFNYYRSLVACPVCRQLISHGRIVLEHSDGMSVEFPVQMYHYIDAGHPITGIDGDLLIEIVNEI